MSSSPVVVVVVAAVVERDGAFLITCRRPGSHLEGYWEFPGGKCEPDESHEDCLRREMREELGVDVRVGEALFTTAHAYPDRTVRLHFYACELVGTPQPRLEQALRWVTRTELGTLSFPPADAELIERLTAADL